MAPCFGYRIQFIQKQEHQGLDSVRLLGRYGTPKIEKRPEKAFSDQKYKRVPA